MQREAMETNDWVRIVEEHACTEEREISSEVDRARNRRKEAIGRVIFMVSWSQFSIQCIMINDFCSLSLDWSLLSKLSTHSVPTRDMKLFLTKCPCAWFERESKENERRNGFISAARSIKSKSFWKFVKTLTTPLLCIFSLSLHSTRLNFLSINNNLAWRDDNNRDWRSRRLL